MSGAEITTIESPVAEPPVLHAGAAEPNPFDAEQQTEISNLPLNETDQDDDTPDAPLSPEEVLRRAQAAEEEKYGPAKGSWLHKEKQRFNKEMDDYSNAAIAHTPSVITNHSSNIIGLMQIAADIGMFASSGTPLLSIPKKGTDGKPLYNKFNEMELDVMSFNNPESWKKPWNFIWYPLRNVYSKAFTNSFKGVTREALTKPSTYKKFFKDLGDLEGATARDRIDELGRPVKLINNWNVRSGLMGIVPMTISAILPEAQQTPEQTLQEFTQRRDHLGKYILTQVGRALWFVPQTVLQLGSKALHPSQDQQIGKYKHQFIGVGFIFSGIFSMLSGFRQVQGKIPGNQHYMRNFSQIGVGFFTMFAGVGALLGIDAAEGWKNFGKGMIMRNVTLPSNIITRYRDNEQGAVPYSIAQAIFQTKNVFATLYGGAHKTQSGEIDERADILINKEKELSYQRKHNVHDKMGNEIRAQELGAPADSKSNPKALPPSKPDDILAPETTKPENPAPENGKKKPHLGSVADAADKLPAHAPHTKIHAVASKELVAANDHDKMLSAAAN